ncbi:probable U3 small nucleolar RNA-associated protein 7 isoform X1 [Juglans regia]|nr:probable U3 small nucleolar RNA-associated protein 7 isoform X1 [Juglans regia]UUJ75361.1 WD40 transcription factor [Juglans regia]
MCLQEMSEELDLKMEKYLRGGAANLEVLQDKKLKGQLAHRENLYGKSAKAAAKFEKWLMPSEGGYLEAEGPVEKTWRFKQEDIGQAVDISSARNQYDVVLPELGPYTMDFSSSGQYMAVAGRKGHLAIVDMKNFEVRREFQVRETVRDVVFLDHQLLFAAAQKKYTYIYSPEGIEIHCLKDHGTVLRLQYLKNHFILASINKFGHLHYQDVSTGASKSYRTGLGRTDVMRVNTVNGVVALGHSGGTVTMWNPNSSAPLVKMLCHHGPVSALAFHPNGHLMATAGKERRIKLWDLRKYEVLQTLPGHANTLDFSQKGLLARGTCSFAEILSGTEHYSRYMNHSMVKGYQIKNLLFRPYEDVLGIGHSMGWSSILVPGSGEPNFDSWVANPFETRKQRREKEVHLLLDKLPPETIMLDPSKIGTVKPVRNKEKPTKEEREAEMEAAIEDVKGNITLKNKTKGRNKPSKRAKKKQEIITKVKRPFLEQQMREPQLSRKKQKVSEEDELPKSLQRFTRKKAAT